jgi:molybdopterin synthase catalytic subunit
MYYAICDEPLDIEAVTRAVLDTGAGGLVTFVGYVRATSDDGRPVTGLTYEAHRDLALAAIREIGAEASVRFGTARVAIAHRIGSLALGEAAVAIAVAAAHRAAAFAACAYAIDELKQRVPIWKKEHYRDGVADWRENVPRVQ